MSEFLSKKPVASRLIALGSGAIVGLLAYVVAFSTTMSIAPRKPEGGRQIVDWPWPLYAWLPVLLAVVVIVIWGLGKPRLQHRLLWLLAAFALVGLCGYSRMDLLRRDYIGKL